MFAGKLYKAVYDDKNLNEAWNKVKGNKGACGIDDIEIAQFNKMVFANLLNLKDRLKKKTYQPKPIRRFSIRKPDGTTRRLGIMTVQDRIAQRAVLQVIEPLFDRHFTSASFGYRKGLSTRHALERITRNFNRGFEWVLDADILEFFPNIDHRLLMKRVRKVLSDRDILRLLQKWLDIGLTGFRSHIPVKGGSAKVGIVQGSPLSPLFANIYLDPLDKALLKRDYLLTRFGDDFIVQCRKRNEAESALNFVNRVLKRLKLELNIHKTSITHFDSGVRFLGNVLKSHHTPRGRFLQIRPLKMALKSEEGSCVRSLPD